MLSWKQRHLATHKEKTIIPTQTPGTDPLTYLPTSPRKSRHMDESSDTHRYTYTDKRTQKHPNSDTKRDPHGNTSTNTHTHPYRPTAASQINLSGKERNLDVLNTYFVPDIRQEL